MRTEKGADRMLVAGEEEDRRRRMERLGEMPEGWPDMTVTGLPDVDDLKRPSELLRLTQAAEELGDASFRLHSVWGEDMEVRIRRPLPPPTFL